LRLAPVGAEGTVVAEGAAADTLDPIAVGASEAHIQGDLVHPLAVELEQVLAEGMNVI